MRKFSKGHKPSDRSTDDEHRPARREFNGKIPLFNFIRMNFCDVKRPVDRFVEDEDEQVIFSVIKRAAYGVRCVKRKCRSNRGGKFIVKFSRK